MKVPRHMRSFYRCDVTKGMHHWDENGAGDVSCSRCHLCVNPLELAEDINVLLQRAAKENRA